MLLQKGRPENDDGAQKSREGGSDSDPSWGKETEPPRGRDPTAGLLYSNIKRVGCRLRKSLFKSRNLSLTFFSITVDFRDGRLGWARRLTVTPRDNLHAKRTCYAAGWWREGTLPVAKSWPSRGLSYKM